MRVASAAKHRSYAEGSIGAKATLLMVRAFLIIASGSSDTFYMSIFTSPLITYRLPAGPITNS